MGRELKGRSEEKSRRERKESGAARLLGDGHQHPRTEQLGRLLGDAVPAYTS